MALITIRKLSKQGDETLTVEQDELARVLPGIMKGQAAAIRTDRAETVFVGSDPLLIESLVRTEVGTGAANIEILVVPRLAGG